jgi:hypothetical protein
MQQNIMKVQYFTKELLLKVNKEAIKLNLNRTLDEEQLKTVLASKTKYPVSAVFEHSDHARVKIVMDSNGGEAWLDLSWERLEKLPVVWCEAIPHYVN